MKNSISPKGLNNFKNKLSEKLFDVLYRRASKFYIEDFPKLNNTALCNIYPSLISHNIEIVDFDEKENYVYLKKDNLYFVTTPDYPWIIREVFCQHIYFINPKYLKNKEYSVFDIGMNRAYASLYFANQPWCKEVFGFELNETTYNIAQKNLELNFRLKDKVKTYNFGLGDKDATLKTYYLPHRDGICTTSKEFLQNYAPEELDRVIESDSLIRKSSDILRAIVENENVENIVVKIDVEGAEYNIVDSLVSEYPDFLRKTDILIGEAHLGLEPLVKQLAPFGFKEVSTKSLNPKTQDFLFVKI